MRPRKRLGQVVKALRDTKSMTQVELAKRARVSQGYVAAIEGGLKRNPSLDVLKRLAKALSVPVTRLLD